MPSKPDGTFTIGVYRKPTHTNLYLSWDRQYSLSAKYSMINTLSHKAYTICSTPQLPKNELHLEKVLMLCKYIKWTINKIFHQQQKWKCHIVVPGVQGICESIKNICGTHWVTVQFMGWQTLNILVSPKDKDSMSNKNSVNYSYSCGRIDCDKEYKEKSSRASGGRFIEYLKAPSPIYDHQNHSGHETAIENFRIIGREGNSIQIDHPLPLALQWCPRRGWNHPPYCPPL